MTTSTVLPSPIGTINILNPLLPRNELQANSMFPTHYSSPSAGPLEPVKDALEHSVSTAIGYIATTSTRTLRAAGLFLDGCTLLAAGLFLGGCVRERSLAGFFLTDSFSGRFGSGSKRMRGRSSKAFTEEGREKPAATHGGRG